MTTSQKSKVKSKKSSGYVLISVIVIMAVIVAMMFLFSDALFSEQAISSNQKSATVCFHLAEAGVQEAVWRIQNDSTTRNTFLNTTSGLTTFSHSTNLMPNASYTVQIQNTAKGAATITGTGYYQVGIKQAKRVVTTKVTKATTPPPYDYDGAIFTGGSTGEEDITFSNATVNITGEELQDHDNDPLTPEIMVPIASLISNRDIWYTDSTISVAKDILAKRNIRKTRSTVTAGGVIQEDVSETYTMPGVDITSADPDSYKSLAQAQNQYFTANAFRSLLNNPGNLTYTGIVYVSGAGFTIDKNETLTINGILISEGNIDIGKNNSNGSLIINTNGTDPSGIISLAKLNVNSTGVLDVEGIIYLGDRFQFDPYDNSVPAAQTINIEGGILTRRIDGNGPRILNIELNKELINQALDPNPDETPVIQVQHWEEEY